MLDQRNERRELRKISVSTFAIREQCYSILFESICELLHLYSLIAKAVSASPLRSRPFSQSFNRAARLSSPMKNSMSSFPFLQLPAELRDKLYRHVLCYDGVAPKRRCPHNPRLPFNPRTQTSGFLPGHLQSRLAVSTASRIVCACSSMSSLPCAKVKIQACYLQCLLRTF